MLLKPSYLPYRLPQTVRQQLSGGTPRAGPSPTTSPTTAAAPRAAAAPPQQAAPVLPKSDAKQPLPNATSCPPTRDSVDDSDASAVRDPAATQDGHGIPADGRQRHPRPVATPEAT